MKPRPITAVLKPGTRGTRCQTCKATEFPCWTWDVREGAVVVTYEECAECGHRYREESVPRFSRGRRLFF